MTYPEPKTPLRRLVVGSSTGGIGALDLRAYAPPHPRVREIKMEEKPPTKSEAERIWEIKLRMAELIFK
jgi:hypothetical protein